MPRTQFFPTQTKDFQLFNLLILGIPFAVCFEYWIVLPVYHDLLSIPAFLHVFAALFIFFNIGTNLWFAITTDTSSKFLLSGTTEAHQLSDGLMLKNQTEKWTFCEHCQAYAPPRSYHCDSCEECILRRDHHCLFTGCCVGFRNQRYFVVACLYIFAGATYGVWFSFDFFMNKLFGYTWTTMLLLLGPHMGLTLGLVTIEQFVLATLQDIAFAAWIVAAWMTVRQVWLVVRGQTWYENKHRITVDCGEEGVVRRVVGRVRGTFGTRWYLTPFSAFVTSPPAVEGLLPGNFKVD